MPPGETTRIHDTPRLAVGVRWSDVVADIDRDHRRREAA
ncbi:DUF6222 family protein [Amycolatopsis nigrescens]|nr:DUF6222 family protein [Amycolatopsis nigrescens]